MTLTHSIFTMQNGDAVCYQCSLDKPQYLKHFCKSPEQKAQHLHWKALNHFSHSTYEDFSFTPQGSCQCSHFWGPLISYICPRMHASKKKSHIKGGFPTQLVQRKNAAMMRKESCLCWQIGTDTDAVPITAIINSTDLFGTPPLTQCTKH